MVPAVNRTHTFGQTAGRKTSAYTLFWTTCVIAVFTSCTLKKPEVPILDFTVSISVANDTTIVQEIAENNSDFLTIESDGQMALDFSTEFGERVAVGDRLQMTPKSNTYTSKLGAISFPGQKLPEIRIAMSDLLGVELPETESTETIPGFEFTQEIPIPLVNVTSLSIEEGGLEVEVTNGLPMPVIMRLGVIDIGNNNTKIGEIDLGTISPEGGKGIGAIDLNNLTISGSLAFDLLGGTEEVEARIQGDPSLAVSVNLRDMTVSQATGMIPQQEFTDNKILEFPDSTIQVTRALIREGRLTLEVRNDIPAIMGITLTLDDLFDQDGKPQSFVIDKLSPDEVTQVTFVLDGSVFAPLDPMGMRISYAAQTFPIETEVTVTSAGEIELKAITETLVFSRVEGILDRLELPFEPVTRTLDFPDGLSNLSLNSTSLSVFATSAVGFRSEMDLLITGTNQQGRDKTLAINEIIERGNPQSPVNIKISPDSDDLTDFLNSLPTEITVDPNVFLGDGVGTETIEPDHWVELDSVVFDAPASFQITDNTRIESDPIRREFSDDEARRRISNNLKMASVTTIIENHIPLGVRVSILVADTPENVYSKPDLIIPEDGNGFGVKAAPTDSEGRAIGSEKNDTKVELTSEDVLVFLEPGGVYTGVLIEIDKTDGERPVQLFGTDFVSVQAGAQIIVELNEQLVE